jgi:hypothetical protein
VRVDLTSNTDVAQHALYDPGVAVTHTGDGEDVLAAVRDGQLFVIDTAADGEIHWCLLVGEALPANLRPRVERETRDVLLHVPTGQLCASGLEQVGRPPDSSRTEVHLSPGAYVLDVYELDFDWDRDVVPVLETELGTDHTRELRIGSLGGFLFVLGLVVVAIGVIRGTFWLASAGVVAGALGVAVLALGLPKGDYDQKKRSIAMRFPSLVVVLRCVDADPELATYRGAIVHRSG